MDNTAIAYDFTFYGSGQQNHFTLAEEDLVEAANFQIWNNRLGLLDNLETIATITPLLKSIYDSSTISSKVKKSTTTEPHRVTSTMISKTLTRPMNRQVACSIRLSRAYRKRYCVRLSAVSNTQAPTVGKKSTPTITALMILTCGIAT